MNKEFEKIIKMLEEQKEIEEYAKPLMKNGKCILCGADVVIHISNYNGHKRYHCDKCGCSVME